MELGAVFKAVIEHAPALAAAGVVEITTPEGVHLKLRMPMLASPTSKAAVLLPLSRPTTEDGESLASRQRRFHEAIEFAHVEGYPNPADYGLTTDQVGA